MVRRREAWVDSVPGLDVARLVFLDETGFQESIHRERGWAARGETPTIIAPYRGKNVTAIGAIRATGTCALWAQEGYMNKADFLRYLEEGLGPELRDGDIVVMDNLRAHTSVEAREILARFGAEPLFLPPYCPEYNPIEFCWGMLKTWFRDPPRVMGVDAVLDRVIELWDLVCDSTCARFITHCGYTLAVEST